MEKAGLLLLLPQIPHDPGSGAARTMALTVALLGGNSFNVSAIGTTASEAAGQYDCLELLRAQGASPIWQHRQIRYSLDGLNCLLLDVGQSNPSAWRRRHLRDYDLLLERELVRFNPDVVFTYGGHPDDLVRLQRLRQTKVAIVLGLWNLGYLTGSRRFFQSYDAIVTPSQYLADVYRARCGIRSTVLPTPVIPAQVRPDSHTPVFFTVVNPTWEKGLAIVVRLAHMLGTKRPDIPLLIIESRGTAGHVVNVARQAGLELTPYDNIMFSPTVAQAAEFFAVTRATLMPSVVSEGSGRVASESMVAGIPCLVGDRGGLPAEVGDGGFVLPLPDDLKPDSRAIASASVAAPWFELIERLADDDPFYQSACVRARAEGQRFIPETVAPIYRNFFERVVRGEPGLRPFATAEQTGE